MRKQRGSRAKAPRRQEEDGRPAVTSPGEGARIVGCAKQRTGRLAPSLAGIRRVLKGSVVIPWNMLRQRVLVGSLGGVLMLVSCGRPRPVAVIPLCRARWELERTRPPITLEAAEFFREQRTPDADLPLERYQGERCGIRGRCGAIRCAPDASRTGSLKTTSAFGTCKSLGPRNIGGRTRARDSSQSPNVMWAAELRRHLEDAGRRGFVDSAERA